MNEILDMSNSRYVDDISHHSRTVSFKTRVDAHIKRKALQRSLENAKREIEGNERKLERMHESARRKLK